MTRIGFYELQEVLGAGGMGTVYKGLDTRTNAPVAIKQLKPELTNTELIERFKREGEALRELNHPNIVKMLDAVEQDGNHYLVMEYLSGGDLKELLDRGKLPHEKALQIAIDICDALTRAHRLDIIHRDLKPANVLIAEDGTPRLTDFGIAHIATKSRVTEADAIIGTIDYLAPEVLNGVGFDARADIWAFGVMLFEMLAGNHPFSGETLTATITAILTAPLPDLEILAPSAPISLIDLVYRMLERDPNARISSVRHVGAALEDILQGRDNTPPPRRFETPISDFQTRTKHNLPAQPTPFIGREGELIELDRLLHDHHSRLMTILAPGGMGKTRLAFEAAENALPHFADGVYMVELAPLSDPNNLVSAVASATEYPFQSDGRTPKQQLLDFFSQKSLLLIMDNFEHLLEGAELMSDILRAAPHVKILATSRERLNLQEETLFRIEGMDFPDWETPEDALEYSAVKLFLHSARRVRPDFELQTDTLMYVAHICRLVEGLPLGIVLAAAWVDALSLQEIAEEISRNVDFLETQTRNMPERHRSIRAVFDYSWNLLTEAERAVLMKLSVFRGGFTREAAEAVTGANLRTLISLMNKSLIRRAADTGRYDIHELTRQYAVAHLSNAGEEQATQHAHVLYFADFMAERYLDIKGRRQLGALDDIEADFENIRTAWQWAYQHNERVMIDRMLDGLYWYQDMRGQYHEGVENLLAAEAALDDDHDAVFHRVRVRRIRHIVLPGLQEFTFEDALIYESLEAAQVRLDTSEYAFCLILLGSVFYLRGLYQDSLAYVENAYQQYQELGDAFFISETLVYRATARRALGKPAEAVPIMEQTLELKQRINDVSGIAWALLNYTALMATLGNFSEAEKAIRRSVEYMRQLRNVHGIFLSYNLMSRISLILGNITEAQASAKQGVTLAIEKNNLHGIIQASSILGFILSITDNDPIGLQNTIHNLRTLSADPLLRQRYAGGLLGLCFVVSGLNSGDYETARVEFVVFAQRPSLLFPSVIVLAVKAVLEAYEGRSESAAEWLAVAFHYPYQNTTWLENWVLITRLRADLKTQLGEASFDAAWERGKTRNMETVVQEMLGEFRNSQ